MEYFEKNVLRDKVKITANASISNLTNKVPFHTAAHQMHSGNIDGTLCKNQYHDQLDRFKHGHYLETSVIQRCGVGPRSGQIFQNQSS